MKTLEDDVRNTLCLAKMCYEAWRLFVVRHPEREQIKFVYNNYLDFFNTLRPALYCTFVIKVSSLFSTSPNDITLDKLPGVKNYSEFKDLWNRGRRLYKYRNKLIAHRDKEIFKRNYTKETGFTYDDLRKIVDDSCSIFDSYAQNNNISGIPDSSCEKDLLELISDIYQYKKLSNRSFHLIFFRYFPKCR